MARLSVTLDVVDSATPALKLAQAILLGNKIEAAPFPAEAAICVRDHRISQSRMTAELVPSPAFLRWLADHIEADLTARV